MEQVRSASHRSLELSENNLTINKALVKIYLIGLN